MLDQASALLARYREGDVLARDRLLVVIHPTVYRWALACTADPDDADDVAQQTLVSVARKLDQFRGDAPLGVWLYRITAREGTRRRVRDRRRERLRASPGAAPDRSVYVTDPGGRVDRERLAALVHRAYLDLPPQQRAAMGLVDLQGYAPKDAAEMMDLAPVSLRANLFKARAAVRRRILELAPELAERFAAARLPVAERAPSTPPRVTR